MGGFSLNLTFEDFSKKKSFRKFKFHLNRTRIKGTLPEDQYTFFIISRPFLLRMTNISSKPCTESQNAHFFNNFCLFPPKIVPFIRKCGKNIVERGRSQMTIRRMLIACWIPKAKNTHSEYVMVIAFPLQHWLQERV
jgi:hypothetical protein